MRKTNLSESYSSQRRMLFIMWSVAQCIHVRTMLLFFRITDGQDLFVDQSGGAGQSPVIIDRMTDAWGEWSSWTGCSKTCGSGRRSRERDCETKNKLVVNCTGTSIEVDSCNTQPCPGDYSRTNF